MECTICRSLSYLSHSPLHTEKLYGKEYFEGSEYVDYVGERRIHEINFSRKWQMIKKLIPGKPKVFEIGCAHGYFINHILKNGASEVFGVDISADALESARKGFGDHFGEISEIPQFEYNCLVAWDVWEHLPYPFETFRKYTEGLALGGIVALTTVDVSSLVARIRGKKWRQIHPPTHLHYPSRQGLQSGLERMGLRVLSHGSFGPMRSWKTYLSAIGLKGGNSDRGFTLNLGDIQLVVARKTTR